jgi:protein SCO1/2
VRDGALIAERVPGDLVIATLVVRGTDAYLSAISKVSFAPLAPDAPAPEASSGFELLKVGDPLPEQRFVDESGRSRQLADWRGHPLAITFIYTRCPLPTFCPLMDRNFVTIQTSASRDPALRGRIRLLSISFDPQYDTPAVLREHAKTLKADPAVWSFLTGDRDEIDRFGARFGVSIMRDVKDPRDITHNLRTVIVDAQGRVAKIYNGFDWTPQDVIADLKGL